MEQIKQYLTQLKVGLIIILLSRIQLPSSTYEDGHYIFSMSILIFPIINMYLGFCKGALAPPAGSKQEQELAQKTHFSLK